MIAFALVTVSLARLLERAAPPAAATLTLVGLIRAAGGVGYGIDSIQAAISTGSIQETDRAVPPLTLQLPGVLFPLSLIGLGVMLARTETVAPWLGWTLAARALLLPLSRIRTSRRWRLPPTPSL